MAHFERASDNQGYVSVWERGDDLSEWTPIVWNQTTLVDAHLDLDSSATTIKAVVDGDTTVRLYTITESGSSDTSGTLSATTTLTSPVAAIEIRCDNNDSDGVYTRSSGGSL